MMGRRERRNWIGSLGCTLSLLILCFAGYAWLADSAGEAAGNTLQLVRLSVSSDSGLVRIEITADGSLSEATIEQSTRGSETIIRVRGARSLLRANYSIDDALARNVRTVSGEHGGEPFVDVVIARGNGGTLAQRVNFNRLVIAIASDFARLRRRPRQTNVEEQARHATIRPRNAAAADSIAVDSAGPVARVDHANQTIARVKSDEGEQDRLNDAVAAKSVDAASPLVATLNTPKFDFAGQTIRSNLPTTIAAARRLSRPGRAGVLPMFLQTSNAALGVPSVAMQNFTQMTLDAPGARPGVWVPGTTAAATDEVGGHILGPGILRPSFLFGAQYDDNLFYRSGDGRHVTTFTVAPRLEYEIPGIERAMRIAYEARLRRLSLGRWANGHFLDFDARLRLSRNFNVALRNHFARSAMDPNEYDPASESYIVGDTFTRNDVGTRLQFEMNDRTRMNFDLGYNVVRWGDRYIANAPLFLDYDIVSSAVGVERDISPDTTLLGSVFFDSTNTFVSLRPQFAGFNDNYRYGFMVGGRSQTSEAGGIAMRVGYEQSEYRHAPRANNLRTLVFDMAYRLNFRQNSSLELAALRKTQVSIFNLEGGNARLDTTGISGRLEHGPVEALKLGLTLNYQHLGYPLVAVPGSTASGGIFVGDFAGRRRADHLYGFSLEAAYRWSELLRGRLVYSFLRRDATIPIFTFNRNKLSLVFEWGRRNDTRGRPF
jgi:hypothetical protein